MTTLTGAKQRAGAWRPRDTPGSIGLNSNELADGWTGSYRSPLLPSLPFRTWPGRDLARPPFVSPNPNPISRSLRLLTNMYFQAEGRLRNPRCLAGPGNTPGAQPGRVPQHFALYPSPNARRRVGLCTFPVALRGSTSVNTTECGSL